MSYFERHAVAAIWMLVGIAIGCVSMAVLNASLDTGATMDELKQRWKALTKKERKTIKALVSMYDVLYEWRESGLHHYVILPTNEMVRQAIEGIHHDAGNHVRPNVDTCDKCHDAMRLW